MFQGEFSKVYRFYYSRLNKKQKECYEAIVYHVLQYKKEVPLPYCLSDEETAETFYAIHGKLDHLEGLKENVLIGKLIPAGTGLKKYRDVEYSLEDEFADEEPLEKLEDEFME